MYNILIYQQGGTLYLDEPFSAQPTAATISIKTLDDQVLTTLDSSFTDITDDAADVSDLVLTLPALNRNAKIIQPNDTSGTITDLTDPHLRLLVTTGGRKQYARVAEFYTSGSDVITIKIDNGLDFDISNGATAKAIRVSYNVDWSSVTSDFVGRVKVEWKVTVDSVVQKVVQVYDVVKQLLKQPATWTDVVRRRPDVDDQTSEIKDKESLVTQAWEDVVQDMYTMGIRHNLVIQDGSTTLRDAVVYQTLYNLTLHQNLPIPSNYESQGDMYIENLTRQKNKILGSFDLPVDDNQNGSIENYEEKVNRRQVWMRAPKAKRGRD